MYFSRGKYEIQLLSNFTNSRWSYCSGQTLNSYDIFRMIAISLELAEIYNKVRPWGLSDRALRSIEDVTNPMLNSINEKCARIKKVFVAMLDSSIADQYYIKGVRGEAKKIALPRDLVVWE